jgi:hypothetical protein
VSTPEDLNVIRDYCNRAAINAVAELIRAQGGELGNGRLALPVGLSSPPAVIIDEDEVEIPCQNRPTARVWDVTTTPIPGEVDERTWWQRVDKVRLTFRCLGVLASLGALAAAAWIVIMVVQSIVAALTTIIPMVLGVLGVIAIIVLLCSLGGGGGRGFSGTFQGRMH